MWRASRVHVGTITLNNELVAADTSPQTMQENDSRISVA